MIMMMLTADDILDIFFFLVIPLRAQAPMQLRCNNGDALSYMCETLSDIQKLNNGFLAHLRMILIGRGVNSIVAEERMIPIVANEAAALTLRQRKTSVYALFKF